ncbi:acyl transferase [Bacteroidota bacterium]
MISTDKIFNIKTDQEFKIAAIEIFKYQANQNKIYKKFLEFNKTKIENIKSIEDIPFLPIEFFKVHKIITGDDHPKEIFLSSGTSGQERSKHYITNPEIYKLSFRKSFSSFYGDPNEFCFLGLLPSYLERKNSSLVFMMDDFIKNSKYKESGFYLHNHEELYEKLCLLNKKNIPTILVGVSFALIEFADKYAMNFDQLIIMETGGMKGQREEITRTELHNKLKKSFGTDSIHSEYGMTELLSQAYSKKQGKFYFPKWVKILIRDTFDPKNYVPPGKSGGINIIDLANINSICFIETQDIGKINSDNSFEVLGRMDNSEIRGCNLLISDN